MEVAINPMVPSATNKSLSQNVTWHPGGRSPNGGNLWDSLTESWRKYLSWVNPRRYGATIRIVESETISDGKPPPTRGDLDVAACEAA